MRSAQANHQFRRGPAQISVRTSQRLAQRRRRVEGQGFVADRSESVGGAESDAVIGALETGANCRDDRGIASRGRRERIGRAAADRLAVGAEASRDRCDGFRAQALSGIFND